MKEQIREILLSSGASAVGFSKAGAMDSKVWKAMAEWIDQGNHADMGYLNRHLSLKKDTSSVLKEGETVISMAFNYAPPKFRNRELSRIASYAYGEDYHIVLRELLQPCIEEMKNRFGGKWRLCIDSAPLAERYWALKAGLGMKGYNGSIIIKGTGSYCFLAEIITTLEIEPDIAEFQECLKCGKCIEVCPGKAIKGDGTIEAAKCINYITIEKKDSLSDEEKLILRKKEGYLFGCDDCLRVCPHNQNIIPTIIQQFHLNEGINTLTSKALEDMNEQTFKQRFSRSPLSYAGYERLKRNALNLINRNQNK